MKLVQKLALNKWGPGCHKPIYRVLTAPVLLLESKDFNFVLKKKNTKIVEAELTGPFQ